MEIAKLSVTYAYETWTLKAKKSFSAFKDKSKEDK